MCCPSGVCGPNVNEKLVHLAAFLRGLDKKAYSVERYNLSQQPGAYATHPVVAKTLQEKGTDALPLIFINEDLICSGDYPTPDELADQLKIGCSDVEAASSDCCSGGCCL